MLTRSSWTLFGSTNLYGMHQPMWDGVFLFAGAVDLKNALEQALAVRLPTTLVFDHPTPAALSEHLADLVHRHAGMQLPAATRQLLPHPPLSTAQSVSGTSRPLVQIAAAVNRLPGGSSRSHSAFSALPCAAVDSGAVLQLTRWDADAPALAAAGAAGSSGGMSMVSTVLKLS